MPAGVGWNTYLKMFTASMLSMMAGAQVVHMFYRPLENLGELVEAEKERMKEEAVLVKSKQGEGGSDVEKDSSGKDSSAEKHSSAPRKDSNASKKDSSAPSDEKS